MLQALSSNASPAAVRPKLKALVFDRKSATSGDKSKDKATPSKAKLKKEGAGGGVKPRTLLSTSCYELKSQSASIQDAVQLHLTNYYYIQVVRHPEEASHVHSVFRQHSVVEDSFREHSILHNVFLVESPENKHYLYKMEKHKTLKQWLSKVAALKKEASEQLESCIVNGAARHGEISERCGSADRETRSAKHSPELTQASRPYSGYSQGPGSPVLRTSLTIPVVTKKRKSRTLERFGGSTSSNGGQGKKGGLFRRGTDSQIIVSPEEPSLLRDLPVIVNGSTNGLHRSNQLDMNTANSTSGGGVNFIREDASVWLSPEHSLKKQSSESLARVSMAASLEDVILEERAGLEGGVAGQEDLSDGDSDAASCTFSCNSSRCSSTRSFRSGGVRGSSSCNKFSVASGDRHSGSVAIVTNGCVPYEGDLNEDGSVFDEGQTSQHPGFIRRAGEQFMGLLQMRSLRERGRSQRSRSYARTCYSTSDLDHVILKNKPLPIPSDPTDHQRQDIVSPSGASESANRSLLTTPTSVVVVSSPTSSPHSESDTGGEDFATSKFRHMQIRKQRWKHSPRIQSPKNQSPRLQRAESYQQERSRAGTEVGKAKLGSAGRSVSVSPTSHNAVDQWRSDTPSEVFHNSGALSLYHSSDHTPSASSGRGSSTLPRLQKNRGRITSDAGNSFGKGSTLLTKSPKIPRLFHRRQTSSTSLGKIFDLKSDPSTPSRPDHTSMSDHTPSMNKLHLFPAKDVAMELCKQDSNLLRRIRPEELQDGAWTKKDSKELLAPNVLAMVRSFNRLALMVPTEILAEATTQARSKVIAAYIRIATRCRSLHNYNSLKAILAGLQCSPIYRLSKTWRAVPSRRKKQFDQLCRLMSEEENWRSYRDKLHRHLLTGTPFIPFLGMFLTQVIQMESFNSIKKSTRSKVISPPLSNSYPENSNPLQTSMFDHTHIDPVTLKARRRRSASLGEHSFCPIGSSSHEGAESVNDRSPVFTVNSSMEDHSKPGIGKIRYLENHSPGADGKETLSDDAAASRSQSFDFVDGDTQNKVVASSYSSAGSDYEHAQFNSEGDNNTSVPTVEVYPPQSSPSQNKKLVRQSKISRSCETNNGFQDDNLLGREGGVVLRRSKDVLSLEDISVGFKHRSMSLESLLKAYKENRLSLFHMGQHWEKLRDEENDVSSDDSEDEDEAEKQESPEEDTIFLNSSMCSGFSEELDLSCSTVNSSFNNSLFKDFQHQEVEIEVGKDDRVQEQCSLHDLPMCPINDESPRVKSTTPTPGGYSGSDVKVRSKVKRSTSQRSKGTGRRNRVKLRKPKSFAYAGSENMEDLTSGPAEEVLLKFQTASLGCGLGVASRQEVRLFLHETEPNSEKENHELSLLREAESH